MTLQEDLKSKALSLISQQMANWVVEIQRQIGEHQGNLVRALDDLQEQVARYDEKINEGDIEMAMAEVVANMPPPEPAAAAGPGFDQLKASVAALEKGTSLSEVLTHLVNEVSQYVDRAAMFIVKGPSAIGWYARGVEPADVVKQVNVPLNADTVLRNVNNSRHALRRSLLHSPGTVQALARLGGTPPAVPAGAPPPPPPPPSMSPEETKQHEDAKRFARLVVSEIKLYNEAKVNEGRRNKDIYERLKEDIERGRQMYADRVAASVRDSTNYFYDELVRILAGGDQSALGPM